MGTQKSDVQHVASGKRRNMACHNCRQDKVKCVFDGSTKICTRCSQKRRTCTGPIPTDRSRYRKARKEGKSKANGYEIDPFDIWSGTSDMKLEKSFAKAAEYCSIPPINTQDMLQSPGVLSPNSHLPSDRVAYGEAFAICDNASYSHPEPWNSSRRHESSWTWNADGALSYENRPDVRGSYHHIAQSSSDPRVRGNTYGI
ncbi:uncharacterized protein FOMMEDRAFT_25447 [Fomitiporia mediterranea MF3/22]|uniref:uncharacterized protein n=1 Tax=Fomitiporia mediterranea (strain MF3/22) TaxID=694068 RepID=UPI00044094BF|nr:uncharacterized protein FOMMEDRAFT_25447 [Fomitiporia mediterranea MF3/22]EJD08339.1 hypothetical protein FOMMEDRAFT_25447 [Fomitiporia mediterranea MF3/22]